MTLHNSIIDAFCTNNGFFVWDAIVAWRDHIFKTDFYNCSKSSYFTNMLKLIETNIVDVRLHLKCVDESWLKECKKKIDDKADWAQSTKTVRKSCLNTFYNFIKDTFDRSQTPYQRHPESFEIEYILSPHLEEKDKYELLEKAVLKHVLSNVADKVLAKDICPIILCTAVMEINERDAYIVWLMMHTGQPLEKILDLRKENLRISYMPVNESNQLPLAGGGYMDFDNGSKHIPGRIIDGINRISKNSTIYLFETATGKRLTRAQVTRNLKLSGRNIGLNYDLTPKVLHGYACAYISREKRSELEKWLEILTN